MSICKSLTPDGAFAGDILNIIDCHSQSIGQNGYQFISEASSTGQILTGILTIFIAIIGYRLLIGPRLTMRDVIVAAIKIGFIITLATNWFSYRTLVYNIVVKEPIQLSSQIGKYIQITSGNEDIYSTLQSIDKNILDIAFIGPGVFEPSKTKNEQNNVKTFINPASGFWDPLREEGTILNARIIFLASSIISLGGLKIIAGILLSIGPLILFSILFENTKGLFIGWLRALIALSIGTFTTSLVLLIETSILSPWLNEILLKRNSGLNSPTSPNEIFILVISFSFIIFIGIIFSIISASALAWFKNINIFNSEIFNSIKNFYNETLVNNKKYHEEKFNNSQNRAKLMSNNIENNDRRAQVFSKVSSSELNTNNQTLKYENKYSGLNTSFYGRQNSNRQKIRVSLSGKRREA